MTRWQLPGRRTAGSSLHACARIAATAQQVVGPDDCILSDDGSAEARGIAHEAGRANRVRLIQVPTPGEPS